MTQVSKLWPLLTATHRYDKSISTWQRGHGVQIEAPILAYLIETSHASSTTSVATTARLPIRLYVNSGTATSPWAHRTCVKSNVCRRTLPVSD
jgi:hypothetical protein